MKIMSIAGARPKLIKFAVLTEWTELVDAGWNRAVGTDGGLIAEALDAG